MSIYDAIGAGGASGPVNPMHMIQQLRRDPAAVLRQRGLNIPAGMNNPQQIVQHLIQSGQVPQSRYMQAMQMMGRR